MQSLSKARSLSKPLCFLTFLYRYFCPATSNTSSARADIIPTTTIKHKLCDNDKTTTQSNSIVTQQAQETMNHHAIITGTIKTCY